MEEGGGWRMRRAVLDLERKINRDELPAPAMVWGRGAVVLWAGDITAQLWMQ